MAAPTPRRPSSGVALRTDRQHRGESAAMLEAQVTGRRGFIAAIVRACRRQAVEVLADRSTGGARRWRHRLRALVLRGSAGQLHILCPIIAAAWQISCATLAKPQRDSAGNQQCAFSRAVRHAMYAVWRRNHQRDRVTPLAHRHPAALLIIMWPTALPLRQIDRRCVCSRERLGMQARYRAVIASSYRLYHRARPSIANRRRSASPATANVVAS